MKTLYACILESLQQGQPIVEVTIIEQNGSAPRAAGTKMLVLQNASTKEINIKGTVGGGLYEAKAMDFAKDLFTKYENSTEQKPLSLILSFDLRGKNFPSDMDMVCGGELRLLVEYIPVTEEKTCLYESLVQAETLGQACTLMTSFKILPLEIPDIYKVHTDKTLFYNNTFDASKSTPLKTTQQQDTIIIHLTENAQKKMSNIVLDEYEYIFETLHKPYTIHIFGAGHVSCELAKITHYLNFKTIVMDDRAEFANAERFPDAVSLVLPSLDQACIENYFSTHTIDSHDGIVIVTRGHAKDRDVLAASLQTKAGYLGMIGSKSKRQTTYDFLLNNGYSKEDFAKIHSPIGLSIGAQTPEEIAISITAELIQWRSKHIQPI